MNFELRLAWRYFQSRRHHPFVNLIRRIAVCGVALAVAVPIVVLAVMNGFQSDLKKHVMSRFAHSTVERDQPFILTEGLSAQILKSSDHVLAIAPFIEGQALLIRNKRMEGILVKAVRADDEDQVTDFYDHIVEGNFPSEEKQEVLIGDVLRNQLGLELGQSLEIVSAQKRDALKVKVSGFFHTGMYEYDAHLIYTSLKTGQKLFGTGEAVRGVAIRYEDADQALSAKRSLQESLGFPFYVRTWADINESLFRAIKVEKKVMFIILTLTVFVACFNIIGTMTLLVIDKTKDIGVLKALGATPGQVMRIFTSVGFMIGLTGALLGLGLGSLGCFALDRFPLIEIPNDIYYFSRLPVELNWKDLLSTMGCAFVLSLFSAMYPARVASKMNTIEILRID